MKQLFKIKTFFLSALLCAAAFGVKAQIANASNTTGCDVIVRFYAVDIHTCMVVATDAGPYIIPAGTPPFIPIPISWVPAPPAAPYIVVAEVADAACGFPGVFVSFPNAPCVYPATAPLPACAACGASLVDNLGGRFLPGSGALHFPLDVHP